MDDDVSFPSSSGLASAQDRKYDVYLSFYGPDTRMGWFVDHLHYELLQEGIRSFIDEDLTRGFEISAGLFTALKESRAAVVIFSQNYGSSIWCLDELVKILECQNLVIPVFYPLEPGDVIDQRGTLGEAFPEFVKRFGDDRVQRWKDACAHFGNSPRWSRASSETFLIKEIVYRLRKELSPPPSKFPFHSSPPPPASGNDRYDVFISFRGADVRYTFASHLHAALTRQNLRVFSDEGFIRGDKIAPVVSKAIEGSRSSVVVLSEGYASSQWCLDELVKILDCRRTLGQLVVPVFYHVDPSNVFRRTGSEAFSEHAESSDDHSRWEDALVEFSRLTGWATSHVKSEAFLVHEIVTSLSDQLRQTYLVGIHSRVKGVMELLRLGSSDVGTLGIYGMPGVGKTTLAKAVYNQIHSTFDASCFLENFRESSGISALYIQLATQISGDESPSEDIITIMLARANVLVVLDDIGDTKELQSLSKFGPRSRIIVTSRDKDVLTSLGVNITYEVKALSDSESLELFSLTAFGSGTPDKDCLKLSERFVDYAAGVPLALKVVGSFLYGRSKRDWETYISKLESLPRQMTGVLKTSFQGLDDEEKAIFLDIACFFNGMDVDFVKEILDGFGFSSEYGIAVLIEKGLLSISDNRLMMQDLVQDMGREIVRHENYYAGERSRLWDHDDVYQEIVRHENYSDAGKRSRLWDHDDARQVLTTNTGTPTLEGICLDLSKLDEMDLSPTAFSKMHNLRFLQFSDQSGVEVCKLRLPGDLDSFPSGLVFLHWHGYPLKTLPQRFLPDNLIELDMPYSHLERLWKGTMVLPNLKRIGLSYSRKLIEVPELSLASNLEKLNLEGCASLAQFPVSVSSPSSLVILNMRGCESLETIPDCSEFEQIPQISWSLKELCLAGTGIGELPAFIKNLHGLVILDLEDCKSLKSLPELPSSLKYLDAHNCHALESVSASSFIYRGMASSFIFSNCFKLERMADNISPSAVQPDVQHVTTASMQIYEDLLSSPSATICFPGTEIPRWFDSSSLGSSITVVLPPSPSRKGQSVSFALCAVVSFGNYDDDGQFSIRCNCQAKPETGGNSEQIAHSGGWVGGEGKRRVIGSEHVFLWCDSFNLHGSESASFSFFPAKNRKISLQSCEVKRCGVIPFSCKDEEPV